MKRSNVVIRMGLIIAAGCLLCGCAKQTENNTQTRIKDQTEKRQTASEIIESPKAMNAAGTTGTFVINTEDMPVMVNMIEDKKEQRVYYEVDCLQEDGTWDSEKPAWNEYFGKNHTYGMISIVLDSKGRFYALIGNGEMTDQKVVRLYEDGNVEEINIHDIKKVTEGEMPIGISLVNDNEILIQYIGDQSTTNGGIHGVLFDLLEEKMVGTPEVVSINTCAFDKNGLFYRADTIQNLIVGKKPGESIASCSIQCEGTLSASSPIIVKDDYGYVLTDDGIYGGKLTDKKWECLLPKEEMQSGYVQNFIKPSGHDSEFYCFQMKEQKQYEWVHYY